MLMVLKRSHFDACIKQLADVSMVFFFSLGILGYRFWIIPILILGRTCYGMTNCFVLSILTFSLS